MTKIQLETLAEEKSPHLQLIQTPFSLALVLAGKPLVFDILIRNETHQKRILY
jgi:hypothetical protein